jgi:hypothetical protein
MSNGGLYNNGLPLLGGPFTGSELMNVDTQKTQGINPESAAISLVALAVAMKWLNTAQDKTMVAGSRYYSSTVIGSKVGITGIEVLVGSTGGSDLWIFELHDSTGALVATTTISGTTAGTANLFQRIAFADIYLAEPGTYYIAVQSNGTTAKLGTFASAGLPISTGSATGAFGTSAAITPPTTYTANLGPIAQVY